MCYYLRKNKVYDSQYGIIKYNSKEDYEVLKKEISEYNQELNKQKYKNKPEEFILFPKDNHIKYIFCGASGSGKTKNAINILKIYCTKHKDRSVILYFSPIQSDEYRDITLKKLREYTDCLILFYNCEEITKIPTIREIYDLLNDLIESKEQLSRTQKKINCLCIFDDCESCTNRKILYDNVQQQINKTIYQIINTLSIAGRSHEKNKPTIEYICIQHNILVGGSIKQFNTILLESNVIGFKYDSLIKRNKKYLEDKFGISFIDKIDNSDILRSTDFVYLRLTYPHKLIFYNRVVEI